MSSRRSTENSTSFLVALLGGAILAYILGASAAHFRLFPYPQLIEPWFRPMMSMRERGKYPPRQPGGAPAWFPTQTNETSHANRSRTNMSEGLRFYTSGHAAEAYLIDETGQKRHRWKLPFGEVWPNPSHVAPLEPSAQVYWRDAQVVGNGKLVAIYAVAGRTPSGHGLVKINRRSKLQWAYPGRTHSDVTVGPDGDIFALEQRRRSRASPDDGNSPRLPGRRTEEALVRIGPEGRVRRTISLLDALATSPFREVLEAYPTFVDSPAERQGTVLRARSIEVVEPAFAKHHQFAEPGHLLVTLAAPDAVGLLDPTSAQFVWMSRGTWWRPSDADALEDGDLLVFDRDGNGGPGLPSRVVRFDPKTGMVRWQYKGDRADPLWTQYGGSQQQLNDDRLLITSPMTGQLLEITSDGRVTSSYQNPEIRRDDQMMIASLWSGQRLPRKRFPWLAESSPQSP
ncbi:MAG: hypothetical protein ABEN55_18945 [Bradymonadaceae bacterium]